MEKQGLPALPKGAKLEQQPPDEQITCTAFGLIHALRIAEAQILKGELDQFRCEILLSGKPFEIDRMREIAGAHGFDMMYLSAPDIQMGSASDLINYFLSCLEQYKTVILAISTHLSKRNRSIPILREQLSPELQTRPMTHMVVAFKEDKKIIMIDSYEPQKPEIFDLDQESERTRLALWVSSAFLQSLPDILNQTEGTTLPEDFYVEKIKAQKLPEDIKSAWFFGAIHYAKIFGIQKKG